MAFDIVTACHMIEIAHEAYHHRVGEHAVVLLAECPLVEVAGKGEAQRAGAQL